MRRHLIPDINPIQLALQRSWRATALPRILHTTRGPRTQQCSCFRQTYSNWTRVTPASPMSSRLAMTCSRRASWFFRLKLALRLPGTCQISWIQIKGMRPSKPTTSNGKFWPRSTTLNTNAMGTSIWWEALRVVLSPFGARWILRAPSATGMRPREHILKPSSAFLDQRNSAIG